MRKPLPIVALIFGLIISSCSEDSHEKMKGHIPDSEVPMPVKTAFSSKYPGAVDAHWDKETEAGKTEYEVEFKFNNKEWEVVYDESGTPIRSKTD